MPSPPANVIATNAMRTTVTSIPSCLAMPAQTPPATPLARSRRRADPLRCSGVVTGSVISVAPIESGRKQRGATDEGGDRRERREVQVQRAVRVEQQNDPEGGEQQAGDQDREGWSPARFFVGGRFSHRRPRYHSSFRRRPVARSE